MAKRVKKFSGGSILVARRSGRGSPQIMRLVRARCKLREAESCGHSLKASRYRQAISHCLVWFIKPCFCSFSPFSVGRPLSEVESSSSQSEDESGPSTAGIFKTCRRSSSPSSTQTYTNQKETGLVERFSAQTYRVTRRDLAPTCSTSQPKARKISLASFVPAQRSCVRPASISPCSFFGATKKPFPTRFNRQYGGSIT